MSAAHQRESVMLTGAGGSHLSALELELRQPGISIGAESVPRTDRGRNVFPFFIALINNRLKK